MSLPRYPKYKDSGVAWLGDGPEHWEVLRLKRLIAPGTSISYGIVQPGDPLDDGVPFVQTTNMTTGSFDLETLQKTSPEIARQYPRSMLSGGEVLLGIRASIGAAHVVPDFLKGANLSRGVARIVPNDRITSAYLVSYFTTDVVSRYWQLQKQGSTFNEVSIETVRELAVTVPPVEEQVRIVGFIDQETAKIDALVAEQQRLIELLKEKRQAVISHAVTKGLNPNAPMKPSGIEWLGDVPEPWEVRRISTISTKITNGYVGPTRDIFVDEGVRYLQSLHIKGNAIRFDVPYFVSDAWSQLHSKSILEAGDVLVVQTGDIGQVTVVPEEFAGANCHALIIVAPLRAVVDGSWLSWVLNSDFGLHSLLSIQTGALHPHLNCGAVKEIAVPLPPMDEQRTIVAHIAERIRDYDQLTSEAQRAIELLQERRTALISAAVTGKIDVRGLAKAEAA